MGKIVRAGAGIFDKLKSEPELQPDKNGPAPQHWPQSNFTPAQARCGPDFYFEEPNGWRVTV
jgi:hypothetical protein